MGARVSRAIVGVDLDCSLSLALRLQTGLDGRFRVTTLALEADRQSSVDSLGKRPQHLIDLALDVAFVNFAKAHFLRVLTLTADGTDGTRLDDALGPINTNSGVDLVDEVETAHLLTEVLQQLPACNAFPGLLEGFLGLAVGLMDEFS